MGHKTLTEDPLITNAVSFWIKLSKIKGILGLMRSLKCAGGQTIQPKDWAWTFITVREMIEALENDLEEAGYKLGERGEFHLAHPTLLKAQPTKDPATVNGNPKGKAKVRKAGSRNGRHT